MTPTAKLDSQLREAGIPVTCVAIDSDTNKPVIHYDKSATPDQIKAGEVLAAALDLRLEEAKEIKCLELNRWWDRTISAGITPDGQDYAMAAAVSDIALLTALYVMARVSIELGIKTQQDTFLVLDVLGGPHILTFAELTAVMLSYGARRSDLAETFIGYEMYIDAARSKEELDAIIFS